MEYPTIEQLEAFKALAQKGLDNQTEAAAEIGVSTSAIRHWVEKLRAGTLDEYIAKVKAFEAGDSAEAPTNGNGTRPKTAKKREVVLKPGYVPPKWMKNALHLRERGMGAKKIIEKLDLGISDVTYYYHEKRAKLFYANQGMTQLAKSIEKGLKPKRSTRGGHIHKTSDATIAKIRKLHAEGLSVKEIQNKVGTSHASVYKYIHNAGESQITSGEENGTVTNAANRSVLIGIAYAETERFIANLSKGIGVPAEILRRRLSELLANPPLRQ